MSDDPCEIPLKIFADTPTCVFWNVEDYPIPTGVDPAWICQRIKEAIKELGCHGEVSIQAYVDEKIFSDELRRKYSDAGFKVNLFPQGDKADRVSCVIFDIFFELVEAPPYSNVFVLLKDIEQDVVLNFEGLYGSCYGVVLSQTQPDWILPSDSNAAFLTRLFDDPSGSSERPYENKKRKITI